MKAVCAFTPVVNLIRTLEPSWAKSGNRPRGQGTSFAVQGQARIQTTVLRHSSERHALDVHDTISYKLVYSYPHSVDCEVALCKPHGCCCCILQPI